MYDLILALVKLIETNVILCYTRTQLLLLLLLQGMLGGYQPIS